MKCMPANNQAKKSNDAAVAERLFLNIERQALSIGWTPSQLEDFTRILSVFIPAKIGAITLKSIEIVTLHSDGSHRGAVSFYNMSVNQLWLKVCEL